METPNDDRRERVLRDWLAAAAPSSSSPSLGRRLDEVTSVPHPAAPAFQVGLPDLRSPTVRAWAAFAAVALLALAGTLVALDQRSATGPAAPSPAGVTLLERLVPVESHALTGSDMSETIGIVRARLATAGIEGATVAAVGVDRISVHLPRGTDAPAARALMEARGIVEIVPLPKDRYGSNTNPGPASVPEPGDTVPSGLVPLIGPSSFDASSFARLDSTATGTGSPGISFRLTSTGSQLFAAYTTAHLGEFIAITLDGVVLSAPYIASPITGGEVAIAGDFKSDLIETWLAVLHSGPLPVELRAASGTPLQASPGVTASSTPSAPATPGSTPTALSLGSPTVLGHASQPVSAIVAVGSNAIVTTWGEGVVIPPGTSPARACTGFPVGVATANGSLGWGSLGAGWIERAVVAADGTIRAIRLGDDCRTLSVVESDGTAPWSELGPTLPFASVDWLGVGKLDSTSIAVWSWDSVQGGTLAWPSKPGWLRKPSDALPVGWDASGLFWEIDSTGALLAGNDPVNVEPTGVHVDATWSVSKLESPGRVTALHSGRLLVGGVGRTLESVSLGGAGTTRLEGFEAVAIADGGSFVAALGTTGSGVAVAVSPDGVTWTTRALPADLLVAKAIGTGRIAALPGRVVLAGQGSGGTVVVAIPVTGSGGQ